jgi:hypothetical protein
MNNIIKAKPESQRKHTSLQLLDALVVARCNSNQNVGCLRLPASAGMEYLKPGMDAATMSLDISVLRMALNIRDRVSPSASQSLLAVMAH